MIRVSYFRRGGEDGVSYCIEAILPRGSGGILPRGSGGILPRGSRGILPRCLMLFLRHQKQSKIASTIQNSGEGNPQLFGPISEVAIAGSPFVISDKCITAHHTCKNIHCIGMPRHACDLNKFTCTCTCLVMCTCHLL